MRKLMFFPSVRKLFLLITILFFTLSYSQKEGNIWYFGANGGLDFNSGAAIAIGDGQINTVEGSASISDPDGNLLFYTDGITVWNKNHEIMPNGSGLLGNASSSQSAVIVPKPGSATIYYIFVVTAELFAEGLTYSEVDISLNGGLGDVTGNKNIQFLTPVTEQITAVEHANGTDYWVFIHAWNSNAFHAYKVTAEGVNPDAVISNSGIALTGDNLRGSIKVSRQGTRLVNATGGLVQLFDLDIQTGIVSNPTLVTDLGATYGAEFSPSGDVLYISRLAGFAVGEPPLLQYNLNANNIPASVITFTPGPTEDGYAAEFGGLQLAPDGKIYIAVPYNGSLAIIENPDIVGTGCNLNMNAMSLAGGATSMFSLPSFIQSFFEDYNIRTINYCLGDATVFSIVGETPGAVEWTFGDGNVSVENNPAHTYANAGTYTVTATVTNGEEVYNLTDIITIVSPPTALEPQDMFACDESGEGSSIFNLSSQDAAILDTQNPSDFNVTYHLSLDDANAGINALQQDFSNTANPQTIFARVTNKVGCNTIISFDLIVKPGPVIDMEDTYTVCEDGVVILTAPAGFSAYSWSTGATTAYVEVEEPGEYTVTVFEDSNGIVCESSKVITVIEQPIPIINDMDSKYSMCNDTRKVTVTAPAGFDSYLWSTGETVQEITISEAGAYTVMVFLNGCENTWEFEIDVVNCELVIPKGISPNHDGKNDELDLTGMNVTSLSIFNRYGQKVYSRENYTSEWNGQTNDGEELPTGTYYYFAATEARSTTGWIYINREE